MRCCWLPIMLFAAAGLAESVGYWTLHNFQLFCDGQGITCAYRFSISQDDGAIQGDLCIFTVDGQNGTAANQTSFEGVNCLGNAQYKINGGWSPMGFITVVATDVVHDLYAFFAYSADMLADEQNVDEQTRRAYKLGTFDASGDVVVPVDKRSGEEWQILSLHQEYDQITGNTELQFAIRDSPDSMTPCTIIARGAGEGEVDVGSFNNKKCIESNWFVSWDHSAITDSATLTVTEPSTMMQASFQWEDVSSSDSLGNSVRTFASPCEDEVLR